MSEELFPTHSHFVPLSRPSFYYEGPLAKIRYSVYHRERKIIGGVALPKTDSQGRKIFAIPGLAKKGTYGLEIVGQKSTLTTAFEVLKSPLEDPHYGFWADFGGDQDDAWLDFYLKFHLNLAQAYDWMYRHEAYLAPSDPFVDPMGKTKSQGSVRERIEAGHAHGIYAFAYGAVYGATNEFAALHPSWVFFDGKKRPIRFIDRFTIMDFATSPWRDLLLENYTLAIRKMGFDGIHMDTYGSPKEAYSSAGRLIRLDEAFVPLINEAAAKLRPLGGAVTFNNVGAWPLAATAKAKDAFDYVEVWDPLSDYRDLLALTRLQRSLSRKPFIVAAYLKPYYDPDETGAVAAHEFLSSLLYAAGAHHLIYGDDGRTLRTGYYPDNHKLSENALATLRPLEDFACRYGDILFDPKLWDVSMTHAGGANVEYLFEGAPVSVVPTPGSFLALIRERKNEKVVSLLNLCHVKDTTWNKAKEPARPEEGPLVDVLVGESGYEAFLASPEQPRLEKIPAGETISPQGVRLRFDSGQIKTWKLIILRKKHRRK